jgi:hypothetical protein
VNYGVCVVRAELDDPGSRDTWRAAENTCMTVSDISSKLTGRDASGRWLLPAGSYELMEYAYVSERNPGNPLYIPAYGENWRSLGRVELRDGQTVRFSNAGEFSGWSGWNSPQPAAAVESPESQAESESSEGPWPSDWIGVWQATGRAEEIICSEQFPDCFPNAGELPPFMIPEDQSALEQYIEAMNSGGQECSMTLNYPDFLLDCPPYEIAVDGGGTAYGSGHRLEGTYDPKTDTFQGQFTKRSTWGEGASLPDEFAYGTWTAER